MWERTWRYHNTLRLLKRSLGRRQQPSEAQTTEGARQHISSEETGEAEPRLSKSRDHSLPVLLRWTEDAATLEPLSPEQEQDPEAVAAWKHEQNARYVELDQLYAELVRNGHHVASSLSAIALAQGRDGITSQYVVGSLSAEEAEELAEATALTINNVLARLFLKLGPPPEGATGDLAPASSGGGGVAQ